MLKVFLLRSNMLYPIKFIPRLKERLWGGTELLSHVKQGKGANVSISFENYHLSSKKMWFMPMENEEDSEMLGLQIALDSKETEDEDLLVAVYSLIEEMIGEYECATMLSYFEFLS